MAETKSKRVLIVAAALFAAAAMVCAIIPGMVFSAVLCAGLALVCLAFWVLEQLARKRRGWKVLLRIGQIGFALLIALLLAIECWVIRESRADGETLPARAVIVLGAGVNGTRPSAALKPRIDAAAEYLEKHPDIPAVLTGCQGTNEEISEAECIFRGLTEAGIDPDRLILEERAENTAQNFAFSRKLLEDGGIDVSRDCVAVVTNDFHMARSKYIAARQGFGCVTGVPAEMPLLRVNYFLREAFAMVKTVLFDG